MAKAYGNDLRERVVKFVLGGGSRAAAARVFSVHRDTVYKWLALHASIGDVRPRKAGRKGGHGKVDVKALTAYVHAHADHTLKAIGRQFGVSDAAICKRLQKLDITHKKNLSLRRTRRKRAHTLPRVGRKTTA